MELYDEMKCTGNLLEAINATMAGRSTYKAVTPNEQGPSYYILTKVGTYNSACGAWLWDTTGTQIAESSFHNSEEGSKCVNYTGFNYIQTMEVNYCFGANETITVKREGKRVMDIPMREAMYGDKVLSVSDENMEEIWDEILFFDHFAPFDGSEDISEMVKITLETGKSLTISGKHLIWKKKKGKRWEKVRAENIFLGDFLHVTVNGKEKMEKVVFLEKIESLFRNIATKSGNIKVNGISAGAYDPILKNDFLFHFIGVEKNDRFIGAFYSFFVDFLESTGLFDLRDPIYGFYLKKTRHLLTYAGLWNLSIFFYQFVFHFLSFLSFLFFLFLIARSGRFV